MKTYVLLSLLLALGCVHVHGAPVEQGRIEQGSCEDALAKGAAELALGKINKDRTEGYVLGLHRLSNVHMKPHGENGMVFYLTLDVVETNCSVLSRKEWKDCEIRSDTNTPVYGQCKAAIYISRVHRVVRLYKYHCVIRPVPAVKVSEICPDCPSLMDKDDSHIQKAQSLSLEKFNKESGLANRFAVLNVTRASIGMGMGMFYNVEYTIQETTCARTVDAAAADKCPPMDCEFAHKGFCKGSLFSAPMGDEEVSVECEIYEPEAAEREKKFHLLGGETDHSHSDTQSHSHDQGQASTHDHAHDHTKPHSHHDNTHKHAEGSDHHHTHDHAPGSATRHSHAHSHDHGHGHDHVHTHHAKAHNHTGDFPNQHHDYKHADGTHTHEHDHELALDHDHKHAHLHDHEHHHHHHEHEHEAEVHDHPEGTVIVLPALGQPMTLPSFPDVPAAGPEVGVTLPLKPDPQIPGEMEPTIEAFPIVKSDQCPRPSVGATMVEKIFLEDPMFKPAA